MHVTVCNESRTIIIKICLQETTTSLIMLSMIKHFHVHTCIIKVLKKTGSHPHYSASRARPDINYQPLLTAVRFSKALKWFHRLSYNITYITAASTCISTLWDMKFSCVPTNG